MRGADFCLDELGMYFWLFGCLVVGAGRVLAGRER